MSVIAKKKKRDVTITPIGYSAQGVTGSCNLVQFNDSTIAVELGGIQEGHTVLANYNLNKEMLSKLKPQDLNYIILLHSHYDHIGLVPSMYMNGKCTATIIVPKGMPCILREMWLDSAKIMDKDCEYLQKKTGKYYPVFYDNEAIEIALSHIVEYETGVMNELNECVSFKYTPAGHILLSQQLELFININNHVKKIAITSDIGNLITEDKRIFVEKFKPIVNSSVIIGESTYGLADKRQTKKDFKKDLEKIKSVITQYCVDNNNRVLIPTFSLDKTPIVLWYLYEMFGNDKNFTVPIIIDSPLAIRLINCYSSILTGDIKEKFDEMMNWKNIRLIIEHTYSANCISDSGAKVILSSGGMLQSGRSVFWAQSIIPCSNDCILFMGYCGENTLGYKLKHSQEQKTITINNKVVKNKCTLVELRSFSSHMQHNELVNYYKSVNAEYIYLLHGDEESRLCLKTELEKEIANMSRTTKVRAINKSTVIRL